MSPKVYRTGKEQRVPESAPEGSTFLRECEELMTVLDAEYDKAVERLVSLTEKQHEIETKRQAIRDTLRYVQEAHGEDPQP